MLMTKSRPFLNQRIVKLFSSNLSSPVCHQTSNHRSSRCIQQVRCYSEKPSEENESNTGESVSSDLPEHFNEPILASKAQQTYKANLSATKLLTNHQPTKAKKKRKENPNAVNLFNDYNEPVEESIIRRPTNSQESHNGIFNPAFSVVPRPSFKRKLKKEDFQRYRDAEKRALENLNLEKYEELYRENLQNEEKHREEVAPNTYHIEDRNFFDHYLENREFQEHTVEMFEELVKCDEDRELIKNILREYELEKYNTSQVPTRLKMDHMDNLMKCTTEHELIRFLKSLFKREAKKVVQKSRQEFEKKVTRERMLEKFKSFDARTGLDFKDGVPVYAKWKNTLFISFNRESLRKGNDRLVRDATLFGPKLVLDFGFDNRVLRRSTFVTLKNQLLFTINANRNARIPFHITMCSLKEGSEFREFLEKNMAFLFTKNSLITTTGQSYTELFPTNDLVYITADASRTLTRVDPDKVHVIAGICDKHNKTSQVIDKARMDGVPTYKLPLEHYFFFKMDRTLTINQTTGMLCAYLDKPDWRHAFVGRVPSRKLKTPEEIRVEQYRRVKKYFSKEKFFRVQKFSQSHRNEEDEIDQADLFDKIFPSSDKSDFLIYGERYQKHQPHGALRNYMIDDEKS